MNPRLLNRAIEMSRAMYEPDYEVRNQHFTFGVYKNRILEIGRNSKKTNPVNILNSNLSLVPLLSIKGTCSEIDLLIKIKRKTNIPIGKLNFINVRIGHGQRVMNSSPCIWCQNMIKFFNPKSIWYSNDSNGFSKYFKI